MNSIEGIKHFIWKIAAKYNLAVEAFCGLSYYPEKIINSYIEVFKNDIKTQVLKL